ncbi:glycerophosphodiester phosphodiesterase GDPDL3-like [Prosopis cineraria]|uniref:glycerophosphodiester phosphodiesterase GDPDL3-like n=1 Tax=Prosopis cineraria TaxID=364024 RepID=UPI00240F3F28|nr:glycerophosphodiester phosphodiesterase GDPDL3-like [Prosopis cineraria]
MWSSGALSRLVVVLLLHSLVALVSARQSNRTTWKTLSGNAPLVIARGGFSGLFPDSSVHAYKFALATSIRNVILWCDVQLTKDGAGICLPDIKLDNATDIAQVFPNKATNYIINGVPTRGYFSVDYTLKDLSNVMLVQGVMSRTQRFDGIGFSILTVQDMVKQVSPPSLWLNIQHDAFYTKHKLSMRRFILSISRSVVITYISSPEVNFLRSIALQVNRRTTKLVFRFLRQDDTEPSVNQTYGSLLKNITFIKSFAYGILVPKEYIWPTDARNYLKPHTSLVLDAQKVGLEVFASDFVSDVPLSFNYSYDPLAEYLQFIDNGCFSVDGVLSDFPITPSEAIDCFAHLGENATERVNNLVISKYGASGDYPACTDLAYQKAIEDGADVLDCPVQMSKDGIPFCLSSVDLTESTTAAQSNFRNITATIPEIKSGSGIFAFNLTWNDIKTLKPSILNPYYAKYEMFRNPDNKNAGNLVTLSDFLSITKNQTSLYGIMIIIENAAYLAEKEGLRVTNAVIDTLSKTGYDKSEAHKVMIQSASSSVLKKFKEKTKYELVYKIDEDVGDAVDSAVEDIKNVADSVVVKKTSVFPLNSEFLIGSTRIVSKLKSSKLSVYVESFSNEFTSQAWDFFSDATVEINSFVRGADIDGVITDFPKTAKRYKRNKCLNLGDKTPPYMAVARPGALFGLITDDDLPPAEAPLPVLTESEVSEPSLPPVSKVPTNSSFSTENRSGASPPGNAQSEVTIRIIFSF